MRCNVGSVAKYVVFLTDYIAEMKTDPDINGMTGTLVGTLYCVLHRTRGIKSTFNAWKGAHDFIAYGFDQSALMNWNFSGHCSDTTGYQPPCQYVTQLFVKRSAATYISKNYGKFLYALCHMR